MTLHTWIYDIPDTVFEKLQGVRIRTAFQELQYGSGERWLAKAMILRLRYLLPLMALVNGF